MSIPNFFYRPEITQYDFGPEHPLRPERLRRTIKLLEAESAIEPISPPPAREEDLLRVHSREYIEAVKRAGETTGGTTAEFLGFGISPGDNPPFERMHEKSLWYVGGAVAAASAVRDGAQLAFNISGGLHHAHRDRASGFCIYNDPAIMISILRERFDRVAYVDIDVHHGDGVQWLFYEDPAVLTISIHESGRTLFPGTGFVEEVKAINVPLEAYTTGDVWLWAFRTVVPAALEQFRPGAIVLQMGTDAHFADQIAHLMVSAQEWLEAVRVVRDLSVPIAACGGGGYNLTTVPRMWAAACMTLAAVDFSDAVPRSVAEELGFRTYADPYLPTPRQRGLIGAQAVVAELEQRLNLASSG